MDLFYPGNSLPAICIAASLLILFRCSFPSIRIITSFVLY